MLHRDSRAIIMTLPQKLVISYIQLVLKNNFYKILINMIIFIKLSLYNYGTYYSKICLKIKRPVIIRTIIISILYRVTMTVVLWQTQKKNMCIFVYVIRVIFYFSFKTIHF